MRNFVALAAAFAVAFAVALASAGTDGATPGDVTRGGSPRGEVGREGVEEATSANDAILWLVVSNGCGDTANAFNFSKMSRGTVIVSDDPLRSTL